MQLVTKKKLGLCLGIFLISTSAYSGGDPEYGEYLSAECVTCHQANAADAQIPSIEGMSEQGMIGVLKLYRSKDLDNQSMQTVTMRLNDEDIAALAAYYSSLPTSE
ncbi:MAG: c-type cytochrome [Rhizobiaceae bacterium]